MSAATPSDLEDFCRQRPLRAGSLIVSAFGDAVLPYGGRLWLGSLIRLLRPCGLNERQVRTAVFRLVRDEWLHPESVGRRADYCLTAVGRRRFEAAARHIYAAEAPRWDGRWRLLLVLGERPVKEREQLRKALFWQGFGAFGSDCFVHPGADLAAVCEALAGPAGAPCPGLLPLLAAEADCGLPACNAELVAQAWNLPALAASYAGFLALYRPLAERLATTLPSDEQALRLRLLLIHDYRRLLLRDPQLPAALLPADWPGEQARRLCAALYRQLLAPSEAALAATLSLADGRRPHPDGSAAGRFQAFSG